MKVLWFFLSRKNKKTKKPLRVFIFFLWHKRRKEKRNKKETPFWLRRVAFEKAPQNFNHSVPCVTYVSAQTMPITNPKYESFFAYFFLEKSKCADGSSVSALVLFNSYTL